MLIQTCSFGLCLAKGGSQETEELPGTPADLHAAPLQDTLIQRLQVQDSTPSGGRERDDGICRPWACLSLALLGPRHPPQAGAARPSASESLLCIRPQQRVRRCPARVLRWLRGVDSVLQGCPTPPQSSCLRALWAWDSGLRLPPWGPSVSDQGMVHGLTQHCL